MSATADQIARVRRMVAEADDSGGYTDAILSALIEEYPLYDLYGYEPEDTDNWTATYDLARAAADVWEEKASAVAADYDLTADGATLNRSQVVEQYKKQARLFRSRGHARMVLFGESKACRAARNGRARNG